MKKLISLPILLLFSTCTKDFENINTNPATANDIPPEFLFSTAILQASLDQDEAGGLQMAYSACMIQHLASPKFNFQGDKYYHDPFHADLLFQRSYGGDLRNISEALFLTENKPDKANLRAMLRILRAMVFQRLTDVYGDLPYSEAGQGFRGNIYEPRYDRQQDIYADILKELDEATASLDAAKPTPGAADFIYGGNVEKWRRFANSLLLRAAMRLTKIDPAMAETWAKKALAAGVMTQAADEALVPHATGPADINKNGVSFWFQKENFGRLNKTFVDWLAAKGDPRLAIFSFVKNGSPAIGFPSGLDDNNFGEITGVYSLDSFSQVNPNLLRLDAPTPLQTLAEVEFLAAEAAVRGWGGPGDAALHYVAGIRAAMQFWARFDASLAVPNATIDDYIMGNPLPADPNAAIQILNEQYWAATFLNDVEAWANWRRTGFPVLVPVVFPGNQTGGTIPRRLQYPLKEYSVNEKSVGAAVARQGKDVMTTRVWWDK